MEYLENEIKFGDFIRNHKRCIVYFFSDKCEFCEDMEEYLKQLEKEMPVGILKVDIEMFEDIAEHYAVDGVPWLLIFKEGLIETFIEGYPEGEEDEITKDIRQVLMDGVV